MTERKTDMNWPIGTWKAMFHPSMFQTEAYESRQILSNFYSFN